MVHGLNSRVVSAGRPRWARSALSVSLLLLLVACGRDSVDIESRTLVVAGMARPDPGAAIVPVLELTDDKPAIVYHDGSAGTLHAAYPDGVSWAVSLIAEAGDSTSHWLAGARDDDGVWQLVFRDAGSRNIVHLAGTPGAWVRSDPAPAGEDRGQGLSLALDLAGHPWIAYRNDTREAAEVAWFGGGAWRIEIVDENGNAGYWPSIAADPGGRMGLAYQEGSQGELRYARSLGAGTWQQVTVDTGAGSVVGARTALRIQAGRNQDLFLAVPRILYLDESDYSLRYATATSGVVEWAFERPAPGVFAGSDSCMDVADDGTVWIAFMDNSGLDLRVGRRGASGWRSWLVESAGATGFAPSCRLDSQGRLHVAYARRDLGELRYRIVDQPF